MLAVLYLLLYATAYSTEGNSSTHNSTSSTTSSEKYGGTDEELTTDDVLTWNTTTPLSTLGYYQTYGPEEYSRSYPYTSTSLSPRHLPQQCKYEKVSLGYEYYKNAVKCTFLNYTTKFPEIKASNIYVVQLNFEGNTSLEIPEFAFSGMTDMINLYIFGNFPRKISPSAFLGLHKLNTLVMSSGRPISYFNIARGWIKIEYTIDGNICPPLFTNSLFDQLPELETLSLPHNNISRFPIGYFCNLKHLTEMHIPHNRISNLYEAGILCDPSNQSCEVCLPELTDLNLSHNNISDLPKDLKDLPSLTRVFLDGNKLTLSTQPLCDMKHLNEISLQENKLRNLPKDFFSCLKQVHTMNLASNYLTEEDLISAGVANMRKLGTLNINNNMIRYLKPEMFVHLEQLTTLDVNYNQIITIDVSLAFLPSLVFLSIRGNHLDNFTSFPQLPKYLRFIDLSRNNISSLSISSKDFPTINTMNLMLNKIKTLDLKSFVIDHTVNPAHPSVYLRGNPLHCDCNLEWIRESRGNISVMEVLDFQNLTCGSPDIYANKSFYDTEFALVCPYTTQCIGEVCDCCSIPTNCSCHGICYEECTCVHNGNGSINVMDCSAKGLTSLKEKGPYYVNTIRFDNNTLSNLSSPFHALPHIKTLFLNNSGISYLTPNIFTNLSSLKTVYLHSNRIKTVDRITFSDCVSSIQTIDLHDNIIESIDLLQPILIPVLQNLSLHNNNLSRVNIKDLVAIKTLRYLTLHQNPWLCDCAFGRAFQKFINRSSFIANKEKIMCRDEQGKNHPIMSVNIAPCKTVRPTITIIKQPIAAIVCLILGFTLVLFIWIILHFYGVMFKVKIYNCPRLQWFRLRNEDLDNLAKPYDIFLSYVQEDFTIVENEILKELEENKRSYKVCFDERDFAHWESVTCQTVAAVEQSKRTILFVSEHFSNCELLRYSLLAAHFQVLDDKQPRVILILKDRKVRSRLEGLFELYAWGGTYLVYQERNFWSKLYRMLANNPRGSDEMVGRRFEYINLD